MPMIMQIESVLCLTIINTNLISVNVLDEQSFYMKNVMPIDIGESLNLLTLYFLNHCNTFFKSFLILFYTANPTSLEFDKNKSKLTCFFLNVIINTRYN